MTLEPFFRVRLYFEVNLSGRRQTSQALPKPAIRGQCYFPPSAQVDARLPPLLSVLLAYHRQLNSAFPRKPLLVRAISSDDCLCAQMKTSKMNHDRHTFVTWGAILILIPAVLTQNVATVTPTETATAPLGEGPIPSTTTDRDSTPTPSDNAPSGNDNDGFNSAGLVNYYFVFIALILCVVALGIFLTFRQRKMRALRRIQLGQGDALQRDLGGSRGRAGWSNWNPEGTRGRYWQGRWRSAEASREEGLNELGEPPPAYLPKRQSEEGRERSQEENGPAIPLQTLSREDTGLKPPDYTETHAAERHPTARNSSASASSSRNP